eukprot:6435384-Prorocentrum_lima.AAC.1
MESTDIDTFATMFGHWKAVVQKKGTRSARLVSPHVSSRAARALIYRMGEHGLADWSGLRAL